MGRWKDLQNDPQYQLLVRQHRATLDVAAQIEAQMRAQGVKKSGLAERLDKTRAWISKLLHGGQNLTVFTIVEVANALNSDVGIQLVPRTAATASFRSGRGWRIEKMEVPGGDLASVSVGGERGQVQVQTVSSATSSIPASWSDVPGLKVAA